MGAVEDILQWSADKLPAWRQDALRRLACASSLTEADYDELLALVKDKVGFSLPTKPPSPVPLTKAHIATASGGSTIYLVGIRNVKNVNRLVPDAGLPFAPKGITVIYGRNGSGKSGFVRILRTACRTRTDNPTKLKVLADVYGSGTGPQGAEIVVNRGAGDEVIPWTSGASASDDMLQVAVFDSTAAQLYVDGGNQIQFLPFGLALPHKLNEVCIKLKERLEIERRPVSQQIALATISFPTIRTTKAQSLYSALSSATTDAQIDEIAKFEAADQGRLDEIIRLLASGATSTADLKALSSIVKSLAAECSSLHTALDDSKLEEGRGMRAKAAAARAAADLDATTLFSGEPLPGVGSEVWRRLWLAAREYSLTEAYVGRDFPALSTPEVSVFCVLCHQPLSEEASQRLSRFQTFVSGKLTVEADSAEEALAAAVRAMPKLAIMSATDWQARLDQIRKRDPSLAEPLTIFKVEAERRHAELVTILGSDEMVAEVLPAPPWTSPTPDLEKLSSLILTEATKLENTEDQGHRQKLGEEQAELEDRKLLTAGRAKLVQRRDLMKEDKLYEAALAEVQTTGITKKANELVDVHLTKVVVEQYENERKALDIIHLKVGLSRKSDQTKAAFQTNPGTKLTKLTSDILSEGEQRALALAAFMTEVAVTEGSGPIVIDDPVSSLDRERGLRVAARIADEARKRQVIVFTHDLIFFNDLCRECDERGVPAESIALFSDVTNAGKIDPAGVIWKGVSVSKRISRIRDEFAKVRKLCASSPADYEFNIKSLYGRLRDTYERVVEECIFCDVVRRGTDRIETMKLRMVHLTDALAIRFHDGMTKANTHSHDNPEAATVAAPDPPAFDADLADVEALVADLKSEGKGAESRRPSMKP